MTDRCGDEDDEAAASLVSVPQVLPYHTSTCLGCGPQNPHGLRLVAYRTADSVYADVTFTEHHVGAPGLAHGGAVAAACDDVLGFTPWLVGTPAVTRRLTVEYLLPVPLNQPHRISAHIEARQGRTLRVRAAGASGDGIIRFTADAVFVVVDVEHFAAHGDVSGFGGLLEKFGHDDVSRNGPAR